jgi:hypothetical protein
MVVGTPFAAGAGAIAGAVKGPSRAAVDKFESVLKTALADLPIQDMIQDRVSDGARQASVRLVLHSDHGPRRPDDEDSNYLTPSSGPVDTVLEVSVSSLYMVGETAYDPPALLIRVRTRLVRVADGTTLYSHRLWYRSRPRSMDAWIARGGQPFRDEVTRACRLFAEKVVEEVFLRVVVR